MTSLPAVTRSVQCQRLEVYLIWLVVTVKISAALWLELRLTLWYPWNVIKTFFLFKDWYYTGGLVLLQALVAVPYSSLVLANEPPPLSLPRHLAEALSSCKTVLVKWMPLGLVQMLYSPTLDEVHIQVPSRLLRVWQTRPMFSFWHMFSAMTDWKQVGKIMLLICATMISGMTFISVFVHLYSRGAGKAHTWSSAAAILETT